MDHLDPTFPENPIDTVLVLQPVFEACAWYGRVLGVIQDPIESVRVSFVNVVEPPLPFVELKTLEYSLFVRHFATFLRQLPECPDQDLGAITVISLSRYVAPNFSL